DRECRHGIDWKGEEWTPERKGPDGKPMLGAHPNARFTAPARQCPVICPDWEDPQGVPIDIFIFGGRRSQLVPLVRQAHDWEHGVFMAATAASEATAAALDVRKAIRRDPMAMLPFCGYNIGDYWQHWLPIGDRLRDKASQIFYVNWFRKADNGKWLWPGYGENSRVLKWMCQRLTGEVAGRETAIGILPRPEELDLTGLQIAADDLEELLAVDAAGWRAEMNDIEEYLTQIGDRVPLRLKAQLSICRQRLA
ncbi:MAG: phosphoenolpyruvate carboxykinase domain-containing protein, partial [Planctomycetota bacterium]|nr:phosphoenolpyruvate carboxykinase domain-containing protein [Planctomycetota bacterium]